MRVSPLTCFAAAGPLLRAPPSCLTTAIPKNDVLMRLAPTLGERMHRTRDPWVRIQTNLHAYNSSAAVLARGGAASKTQTVYHRVKAFLNKRFFLLGAATMVASARLAPSLGTKGGLLSLAASKAGE